MTNLERLKMECEGINLTDDKLTIYLQENDLVPTVEYDPSSKTNKKNILKTALSILESIANNVSNMKNYKTDDISISQFSENLNNRIDALNRKIRLIPSDEGFTDGASFIYMFK